MVELKAARSRPVGIPSGWESISDVKWDHMLQA